MRAPGSTPRAPVVVPPPSGPDRLLGVGPVTVDDAGVCRASMSCGPWAAGPDGRPSAGVLGVLLDAVLGQATLVGRAPDGWALTTELAVDLAGPVPLEGGLECAASVVHVDGEGVLARGQVLDDTGRVVAVATEWGKFVDGPPDLAPPPPVPVPRARDLVELLGGALVPAADGSAPTASVQDGPSLRLPGSPALSNELATVHGGILATASELAAVAALPASAGRSFVTGSLRIAYLRPSPVTGDTLFRTRPVHAGRSFGVVQVEAWSGSGRLATTATVTRRVS